VISTERFKICHASDQAHLSLHAYISSQFEPLLDQFPEAAHMQTENRPRRDATSEVIEICQHFLIGLFHSEPQNTSLGPALHGDYTVRPDADWR
jgi:hypothetical protein